MEEDQRSGRDEIREIRRLPAGREIGDHAGPCFGTVGPPRLETMHSVIRREHGAGGDRREGIRRRDVVVLSAGSRADVAHETSPERGSIAAPQLLTVHAVVLKEESEEA
ncbi:MAG: hypothetical protein U0X73_12195 [Thermoanaerobaculia bacterium]